MPTVNEGLFQRFNRVAGSTRGTRMSGPKDVINEGRKLSYRHPEYITEANASKVKSVKAGRILEDTIDLGDFSNADYQRSGAQRSPSRGGTLLESKRCLRLIEANRPFNETELEVNNGEDEAVKWKDLFHIEKQSLWTGKMNFTEYQVLSRIPSAEMENHTEETAPIASVAHCFPENGVVWPGLGITTIQGIDAAANDVWRCPISEYDPDNQDDLHTGIIAAFDSQYLAMMFKAPPGGMAKYMASSSLPDMVIETNGAGMTKAMQLVRGLNTSTRMGMQDPAYPGPCYNGIPIVYVPAWDSAPLELIGVTPGTIGQEPVTNYVLGTATGNPWPKDKPRYFWRNKQYFSLKIFKDNYMKEIGPLGPDSLNPDASVLYLRSIMNTWIVSRRMGGGWVRPRG